MRHRITMLTAAALVLVAAGAASAPSRTTATKAAPPRIVQTLVVRDLRFVGLESDMVGQCNDVPSCGRNSANHNGQRDGHFRVTVATPRRARILVEVRLAAWSSPAGHGWGAWSSTDRVRPLGMVVGGKALKVPTANLGLRLPRSARGIRMDLYADDIGVFAPGQRFRVFVKTKGAKRLSPELRLPGKRATMSASFAGRGEDLVGNDQNEPWDPKPNGRPDAHFTARLDTKRAWRILTDVSVQRVDANGRLLKELWNAGRGSASSPNPFLLIVVNGQRVPATPKNLSKYERCAWEELDPGARRDLRCPIYVPLPPSATPVRLDLYGDDPDPGIAIAGERFRVTAIFSDQELASIYRTTTFTTLRIP